MFARFRLALVCRGYSSTVEGRRIEKKIYALQKKNNLPDSMTLFDQLISMGEEPSERTLSLLLHLCQVCTDKEKANVILKAMDNITSEPGLSLLTSKLNYYLTFGPEEDMWSTYEELIAKGYKLRLNSTMKLLEISIKTKNLKRVEQLLSHIKSSKFTAAVHVTQLLLETAATEGTMWNESISQLLEIYKNNYQLMTTDTVDLLAKWLTKQYASCDVNKARIENCQCTSCGYKIKSNELTEKEHRLILNHAKLALQKEVSSFEYSNIEEREYWRLEKLLRTSGPFGAVLDGQNISPLKKSPRNLFKLCQLMVNKTSLPVLVITRHHLAKKIMNWVKLPNLVELGNHFNKQKIHFFFTRNRVADDYYFIYSTLASGPKSLLISNDLFGDHIHQIEPDLRNVYQKWQRGLQVNFAIENSTKLTYPKGYDIQLQWTRTHYHIPITDTEWICIKVE